MNIRYRSNVKLLPVHPCHAQTTAHGFLMQKRDCLMCSTQRARFGRRHPHQPKVAGELATDLYCQAPTIDAFHTPPTMNLTRPVRELSAEVVQHEAVLLASRDKDSIGLWWLWYERDQTRTWFSGVRSLTNAVRICYKAYVEDFPS